MSAAARANAGQADPQSGPFLPLPGRAGFFHFALKWIYADPGSISGLGVSNYINRLGEHGRAHERGGVRDAASVDLPTLEIEPVSAGVRTSRYVNRSEVEAEDELGAHVLITRGLPVRTGAQLARLLDAKERKADRAYRQYGGKLPRVASHAVISFRHGIEPDKAGNILENFSAALSERLGVPIEARVHNKDGRPDHAHVIIGTRIVETGKLGRKCRSLDAVSEKADGRALDVGDRMVGATLEWMRSEWAALMREATGDQTVDHRSYARRGLDIAPVTPVPRADIEYERRRGTAAWRDRRRRELAARLAVAPSTRTVREVGPEPDRSTSAKSPPIGKTVQAVSGWRAEAVAALPKPFFEGRQTFLGDAGVELASLLGLDMPDKVLDALASPAAAKEPRAATPKLVEPTGAHSADHAAVRRRAEALLGALTAPAAGLESAIGEGAGQKLADLLGLDIAGNVFEAILDRQSERKLPVAMPEANEPAERTSARPHADQAVVRRRAEALLDALTLSAAGRELTAHSRAEEGLAGPIGVDMPETVLTELLRRMALMQTRAAPTTPEVELPGGPPRAEVVSTYAAVRPIETTGAARKKIKLPPSQAKSALPRRSLGTAAASPPEFKRPGGMPSGKRGDREAPEYTSVVSEIDQTEQPHDSTACQAGPRGPETKPMTTGLQRSFNIMPSGERRAPAPAMRDGENEAALAARHNRDAKATLPSDRPSRLQVVLEEGPAAALLDGLPSGKPQPMFRNAEHLSPNPSAHADAHRHVQHQERSSGDLAPTKPSLDEKRRTKADVNLQHSLQLFQTLQRGRRLTASRTEILAATVGLDRMSFEAAARDATAAAPLPQGGAVTSYAPPPHLQQLWQQWTNEDNEARRARRLRAKENEQAPGQAAAPNWDDVPASERADYDPSATARQTRVSRDTAAAFPTAGKAGSHDDPDQRSEAAQAPPRSESASPNAVSAVPPDYRAGPEAALTGVLERALFDAFAAEMREAALRRGSAPLDLKTVERGVAVRLRATGRGETEVLAVLASCAGNGGPDGRQERIVQAARHAFSAETTKRLRLRPSFVDRMRMLERKTEARLYRSLRREALDELQRDLELVWAERRMRADEAALKHARRSAMLNELCWRTKRARRRSSLVTAILSAMVELAVLRPLIARQRRLAAAEHQAIYDAAARASAELKRLREKWRTHVATQHARHPVRDSQHYGAESSASGKVNVDDDRVAASRDISAAKPSQASDIEERRHLVTGLAQVVAARGLWSDTLAHQLGQLVGTDSDGVWSLACNDCRQHHGHARLNRLSNEEVTTKWAAAWRGASKLSWQEVLRLMEEIAAPRGRNGKDGRGGL